MSLTLNELANQSGGELIGDPALKIIGAASLGEATPGEISFFTDRKYIGLLRKTRASALFVPADFSEPVNAAQIRVSNPTKAFEQVFRQMSHEPAPTGFLGTEAPFGPAIPAFDPPLGYRGATARA